MINRTSPIYKCFLSDFLLPPSTVPPFTWVETRCYANNLVELHLCSSQCKVEQIFESIAEKERAHLSCSEKEFVQLRIKIHLWVDLGIKLMKKYVNPLMQREYEAIILSVSIFTLR